MTRKFPRTCVKEGCREKVMPQWALQVHRRRPLCEEHISAATKAELKAAQDRPKSGRVKKRVMTAEERERYGLPPAG
jgi:cobalamin biosynthesis Mg chelatase CobN